VLANLTYFVLWSIIRTSDRQLNCAGMPRSASDATRFTATGPYAAAKSQFTPSNIPIGRTAAPAGETPQQKIARLRAAAAQARLGQESQFDKVVRVGRVWADRAHRATALSLIGLTGMAANY
jgi:hypothetical protein